MRDARRVVMAAVVTAALAAGTAACDDSPVPGSAYTTPDPLAGLTGNQIVRQTIADLNNTASVRFTGTMTESGQSISIDMTLVHDQGCEGSITVQGKGTLQEVYSGSSVWVRPSDAFYRSLGASAAKISLLSGKWLEYSKGSDPNATCSPGSLAGAMGTDDAGMVRGAITSLGGQPAVIITQAGEPGGAYISDSARPELLRVVTSSGSDTLDITFSGYGLPVTITRPPASETLNGGELGPEVGPIML